MPVSGDILILKRRLILKSEPYLCRPLYLELAYIEQYRGWISLARVVCKLHASSRKDCTARFATGAIGEIPD